MIAKILALLAEMLSVAASSGGPLAALAALLLLIREAGARGGTERHKPTAWHERGHHRASFAGGACWGTLFLTLSA